MDDNPGMIQVMGRILSGLGDLRFATNGGAALQQARRFPPDLVLLDAEMPGISGYEVCLAMKADAALCDVPVIFVTGHSGPELELRGLESGAVDFIAKPISEPLLVARVKTQLRVKRLTDELRRIATIDALTEVSNRRAFDEAIQREWRRARRGGDALSLILVDVDHFKLFNDRYGHPAGDVCLRSVAQALCRASMRPADVVARYGGEEFALLLPQTPRAGAGHVARRVLDAVESLAIPHDRSPTAEHVTVSVGVATYDEESDCWVEPSPESRRSSDARCTAKELLSCADQALYCAKLGGRAHAQWLDAGDVAAVHRAERIARPRDARALSATA